MGIPDEDLLKKRLVCIWYVLDTEHLLCAGHAMLGRELCMH